MIKINLLQTVEQKPPEKMPGQSRANIWRNKKVIFSLLGMAAVAVLMIAFLSKKVSQTLPSNTVANTSDQSPQVQPQASGANKTEAIGFGETDKLPDNPPQPSNKVVMAHAVEETVKEIEGEHRSRNPSKSARDIKPPSRVAYQLYINHKVLEFIKDVTPPDIGFTDLIVSSPGDVYIRGIARSRIHYQSFITKLKNSPLISVKPGILKNLGDDKTAREFSIYGKCKFRKPSSLSNRVVPRKDVQSALATLKTKAQVSGIQLGTLRQTARSTLGSYQRRLFKTQISNCNYPQFKNFVDKLYKDQSKVGILKFSLRSNADDQLNANLDLVLYTY